MAMYRRTPRQRTLVVALTIVSLVVVTLDLRSDDGTVTTLRRSVRDLFSPVETLTDHVVTPIGDAVDGVFNAGELKAENEELRQQLAEAQGELAQIQNLIRENEALRDLMDLEVAGSIDGVVAEVTTESASNFQWTLQVNRGSSDGVVRGQPVVIGGEGAQPVLVGRIDEVSSDRATVLLLQDPTSEVSVRFAIDGSRGILQGDGDAEELTVDDVPARSQVRVGETVVTSGADGSMFPPGLVVGRVSSVGASAGGQLTRDVRMEPVADLDRISRVKILTGLPGDG